MAVSGIAERVGNMRKRSDGIFWIRSIACAYWLMAREFMPVSVEVAGDGSGAMLFGFTNEIEDALPLWHDHKRYLQALTLKAQQKSK